MRLMYVPVFSESSAALFSTSAHSGREYVTFFSLTCLYFLNEIPPFIFYSGIRCNLKDKVMQIKRRALNCIFEGIRRSQPQKRERMHFFLCLLRIQKRKVCTTAHFDFLARMGLSLYFFFAVANSERNAPSISKDNIHRFLRQKEKSCTELIASK